LKSTRHVPEPVKVTLPDVREQPEEFLSNVMTTLSPDEAMALGVYEPWVLPSDGAELAEMVLLDVPAALAEETANTDVASVRKVMASVAKNVVRWNFD
jgi:hypothetical protein